MIFPIWLWNQEKRFEKKTLIIFNYSIKFSKSKDITENIENQFKTFIKELADFLKNHDNPEITKMPKKFVI